MTTSQFYPKHLRQQLLIQNKNKLYGRKHSRLTAFPHRSRPFFFPLFISIFSRVLTFLIPQFLHHLRRLSREFTTRSNCEAVLVEEKGEGEARQCQEGGDGTR